MHCTKSYNDMISEIKERLRPSQRTGNSDDNNTACMFSCVMLLVSFAFVLACESLFPVPRGLAHMKQTDPQTQRAAAKESKHTNRVH